MRMLIVFSSPNDFTKAKMRNIVSLRRLLNFLDVERAVLELTLSSVFKANKILG